ncbi:hypothetical protein Tco_0917314 [Tanacetum coccineum]
MHTFRDDYLINSLRFIFAKESSQIYGDVLPECLTSPEMKESKAYKTYLLAIATGFCTSQYCKKKFKKATPTKKNSDLVPVDEEPITKGKRVKRSVKKSSTKPATVALTEKAQLKEVRKKSLRDFHMTHPSGSGTGAEKPLSVEKITLIPVINVKERGQENESEEQESNSEQEFDDDNQEEEEVDQENESEDAEIESDEDKGMDDTIDQINDDVDARLEELTQTGKEIVQGKGVDVEMDEAQQGNENLETTQEQVVDDAHVTITTVTK